MLQFFLGNYIECFLHSKAKGELSCIFSGSFLICQQVQLNFFLEDYNTCKDKKVRVQFAHDNVIDNKFC